MSCQNFEKINRKIKEDFLKRVKKEPEILKKRITLSWSNWGFGQEKLEVTARRLAENKIRFIELHGNIYGTDLGYKPKDTAKILNDYGIKVSGICGMFNQGRDLSSNIPELRQNGIDYIRRNLDLGYELKAKYFLIVPAAVGRAGKIDNFEFDRSAESLGVVAPLFTKARIKGAIEPIRSAEVSLCHTFAEALEIIKAVNHPGIQHINGDIYHMGTEENHYAESIVNYGNRLVNLHFADTNRGALGTGMLNVDTIIHALYLIGYTDEEHFVTFEPLGAGGDPYPAMYGRPKKGELDRLVSSSIKYFQDREKIVKEL